MYSSIESTKDIYTLLYSYITFHNGKEIQNDLDSFIEIALNENDYTLSTGLLGAGWLLSYLHFNEIFNDDLDELLYDFDDNFYLLAVKSVVHPCPILEDLLQVINYFQQRLQNKSISYNFYRRFFLFETMKMLVEKLISLSTSYEMTRSDLARTILKFSYLASTCVSEKDIEECYYKQTEQLITYYQTQEDLLDEDIYNLKLVQLASIQFGNPHWISQISNMLNRGASPNYTESDSILDALILFLENNKNDAYDLNKCDFKNNKNLLYILTSNVKRLTF